MLRTENLNIDRFAPLSSPDVVKAEIPLTTKAADYVVTARAELENILARRDRRLVVIAGPCSIHCREDALAYANKLKGLATEVADQLLLIMRVYTEKPRTTIGWKGLIYDPELNNSYDIEAGLRLARRILVDVAELGLPVATEILEPVVPQYIMDLVTWAAIGARTAESQTHRQMASGISVPVGFKNATDGSLKVAIDAIKTAMSPHAFIGVMGDGRIATVRTRGNPFGHLILRGGLSGPNYASEYIAFSKELMRKAGIVPNIIVDCSHGNCGKDPFQQLSVMRDTFAQVKAGELSIRGVMLESNLAPGRQEMPAAGAPLKAGVSITDPCIGWPETEAIVREAAAALRSTSNQ